MKEKILDRKKQIEEALEQQKTFYQSLERELEKAKNTIVSLSGGLLELNKLLELEEEE